MADAVTTQTIDDGEKTTILKWTNLSDGTGESAVKKIDVSTLKGSPTTVRVRKIWYSTSMDLSLLWDATADVRAITLAPGEGCLDFTCFGGLLNNAGAGVTGDINLTTHGAANLDTYSIIVELKKS